MELDQNILFESLIRWNYWGNKQFEDLLPRDKLSFIIPYVREPFPVVLIGIRRSGKSSIFSLLMKYLMDQGIAPRQLLLINFEEPIFHSNLSIEFLEQLIKIYRERVNPDKKIYFFLDEIQNLTNWEKWVRREADLKEHKIFLTGSSAKLMSSEIASLLTGRYYSFFIQPLSLKEFLTWRNIKYQSQIECMKNKAIIRNSLSDYIKWGGFPEVILTDTNEKRNRILHQYFDDIIFRDIVLRYQIRDVKLLQGIAEYYLTNMASLHSFNRIRNVFETSLDNVRRYTSFIEESNLIFSLVKFSYKLSEQQKRPRKIYVADTGLRNAISFRFSQDIGKLIENIVANYISHQSQRLFYFGNGSECDFIIKQGNEFIPIQITYDNLSDEKIKKREIQGLIDSMKYLNQKWGLVLTDDLEKNEKIGDFKILFRPVWKFLLENFDPHEMKNTF